MFDLTIIAILILLVSHAALIFALYYAAKDIKEKKNEILYLRTQLEHCRTSIAHYRDKYNNAAASVQVLRSEVSTLLRGLHDIKQLNKSHVREVK